MNANAKMQAKIMKAAMVLYVIAIIFMILTLCGCKESQKQPVWGKGELPVDHQGFFGNDNTARLDYVQNMVLDKHAAILKILAVRVLALEAVDPNAIRLEALESGMEKLTWVEPETPVVEAVE